LEFDTFSEVRSSDQLRFYSQVSPCNMAHIYEALELIRNNNIKIVFYFQ